MAANFGLGQVRIARIFNTYGPRMGLDDGRVVSNFVAQVGILLIPSESPCSYHVIRGLQLIIWKIIDLAGIAEGTHDGLWWREANP